MIQRKRPDGPAAAVERSGAEFLPILATKLFRPPVTPDLEQRTRLTDAWTTTASGR
jgi:hypothetical protein